MNKLILFILIMLPFILFLLIMFPSQSLEEKQAICNESCLSDGWENGDFIGYQFCNCYNVTVVNQANEESNK